MLMLSCSLAFTAMSVPVCHTLHTLHNDCQQASLAAAGCSVYKRNLHVQTSPACLFSGRFYTNLQTILRHYTSCKMLSLRSAALAGLLLLCVALQAQAQANNAATRLNVPNNAAGGAATLTLQFDNRSVDRCAHREGSPRHVGLMLCEQYLTQESCICDN
jgi:hypothetical protein